MPDNLFQPPTLPTHWDTMGENNIPTALKGCEVKNWLSYLAIYLHFDP